MIAGTLGKLLGLIFSVVHSYGWSIVIFTIIVKVLLIPLSISQVKSTKAMSEIQPKVKELQERYKNDKETLNIKTMELYKQHSVNPLGGCLPLLIQLPILFGLFAVLREPATHVFGGNEALANAATGVQFLWMKNLAEPDLLSNVFSSGPAWLLTLPGILPFVSAASTYVQMNFMNTNPAAANSQMKVMNTVMPVLILVWGRTFAAGLLIYWTVSNFFQLAQQAVIMKLAKEDE